MDNTFYDTDKLEVMIRCLKRDQAENNTAEILRDLDFIVFCAEVMMKEIKEQNSLEIAA